MNVMRSLRLLAVAAGLVVASAHPGAAQVAVGVGPAPECPYGYYEVPPYNCAPDGYYGQRNAVRNFTAKPCTTRVVVRLPVDTNRIQVEVCREGISRRPALAESRAGAR
jgi:hypothetical protein